MSDSTVCARCGVPVDPTIAILDDDGRPICDSCEGDRMVDSGFEKVLGGYAGSALGAGLLSICFNPLFIFSAISIVSTFAGTVAIIRSKDVRAAAERRQYLVVMLAVGFAAALLQPALFVAQLALAALLAAAQ